MRRTIAVAGMLALAASGAVASAPASAKSRKHKKPKVEQVSVTVAGGKMSAELGHIGPDGRGHDTFIPASFAVKVGDKVVVTFKNYDEGPHSFTSPKLHLDWEIPAAKDATNKIPSVTKFTFTVKKAGKYRWYCRMPCDDKQGSWAMTTGSDGGPDQAGYMAGYVTAS